MRLNKILLIFIALFTLSCNNMDKDKKTNNETVAENSTVAPMDVVMEVKKKAMVGEGAIWNYKSGKLWWIDVGGKKLFEFDPVTKKENTFNLPFEVGTVVPLDEDNAIIALSDAIYSYNLRTDSLVKKVDNPEQWRFNDGKCDAKGRLWVGTLDTEQYSRPICGLYKVGHDFSFEKMLDSVAISNGIAWSPDGTKMYYIDTHTRKVVSFDFDDENGAISNKKDCIIFPEGAGNPDGCTIDEEGNLWVAMWDGGCVMYCNPETGEILGKYEVPAHNVASVAFGGEDLSTLYITTATVDMSDEETQTYRDAGSLFSLKPGVKGVKSQFFGERK